MRGTMAQRSAGVWRLRVFAGSDPATGAPRQLSRTFRGTKRQASTALSAFVAEVAAGNVPIDGSTTLAEYLERWVSHITPTRSPTTIRGYRFKIQRIDAALGKTSLAKLSGHLLDRTYREWLEEGLDPNSVHHLHRVLSSALRQAVKWDLLPYAPTARATPPTRRTRSKAIPSVEAVQSLIRTAEERGQPVFAAVIALGATTGLRRGELAGLRWSDVDLDARRLTVRRSIKNDVDGSWIPGPPKTHQVRRIALDDFTTSVLATHLAQARRWAEEAGVSLAQESYALTHDPSGATPIRPDALSGGFARIAKAARVGGVSLHTLRHFSASMLVASGRDVRTIAGRLGHSDASTTLRVYAHVVEGRDQDAADFLGSLIANQAPPSKTLPA